MVKSNSKKLYSKKRYSKKRYSKKTKRYSKKRYSKKRYSKKKIKKQIFGGACPSWMDTASTAERLRHAALVRGLSEVDQKVMKYENIEDEQLSFLESRRELALAKGMEKLELDYDLLQYLGQMSALLNNDTIQEAIKTCDHRASVLPEGHSDDDLDRAWTHHRYGHISTWDTRYVTDMSYMFYNLRCFNQPIGGWNTINVTDMSCMFENAESFNQEIGCWKTMNVTNMNGMFRNAINFNQPIQGWTTDNVTNMSFMFFNATSFDQPIEDFWNFNNVQDMTNFLGYLDYSDVEY